MNIDMLEAGREMDAKIATEVMGWTPGVEDYEDGNGLVKLWLDERGNMVAYQEDYWEIDATCGRWSPSTDYADMWQVIDRVASFVGHGHFSLRQIVEFEFPDMEGWQCDFGEIGAFATMGTGDTAPLAVCRAAYNTAKDWRENSSTDIEWN